MAETHIAEKAQKYPINKIRNIGIIAHIDAGKTTTTENILFLTGIRHKVGVVHEGDTVTDWMDQERERGVTIVSAAVTSFWKGHRINIIDTPGHVDFTAEVERSLRVLDGGIVVFDSSQGVEAQTETVWRQSEKYKVPRIAFANKIDKVGGDFYMTLNSIHNRLTKDAIAVQLPLGFEGSFYGVVDLIEEKAYEFSGKSGNEINEIPIPSDMADKVKEYRAKLVEKAAESDDVLIEKYISGEELSVEEVKSGIRKLTIAAKLFPVFCGSGLKNIGIQKLLDGVVDYLPSPLEVPPAIGHDKKTGEEIRCEADENEPFVGLAFKVVTDPYVGRLVYFRVYSGQIKSGSYVNNVTKDEKERLGRIVLMHANDREDIEFVKAGEIAAGVGLKNTTTGDTLTFGDTNVILESISFAEPVISMAIEPKTKSDQEKMGLSLKKLGDEDPTFHISSDAETGQTIISGVGEFQLEIKVDILKRTHHVDVNVGAPKVAYRETIRGSAEVEGKYIKQSGGRGQYGHVWLRMRPLERGEGFKFVDAIKGGTIPREYIPAVEKGIKDAMSKGVGWGYQMVDMEVELYDGSFHEVDSSELAFHIAASMALQEGVKKAGLVLLEPIMSIEVVTPEEFVGDVIGDLSSKRSIIEGTEQRGNAQAIRAKAPLAELFGYVTILRGLTQGRATPTMEPSHYEVVPENIAEKLKGKS